MSRIGRETLRAITQATSRPSSSAPPAIVRVVVCERDAV